MHLKYGFPISHIDDLRSLLSSYMPGSSILQDSHGGIIIDTGCDQSEDGFLSDREEPELLEDLLHFTLVE